MFLTCGPRAADRGRQQQPGELLTRPRAEGYLDGYLMIIRWTFNARAVEMLRTVIERNGEHSLAGLLAGPHCGAAAHAAHTPRSGRSGPER
ncbi:hypothetical protein MOQ72_40045 [Saccharopolyspora sp. K220]|uniref:hypothetical protein n=1 Tax=Saccharopolyspora soli TaxID=2926618 RepID=UPI001F57FC96|nr:hypothetical protein [Saccharopolyspora soli]MCI2423616.1 hypothetical protein [Saccharopolyspora soli]